ncbi:helix-turn-helix domain-containing protein [Sphingomonas sp. SUN019]|uniref:helix-turn-helix domain-containing protein n=1 Tax=Sphingomonas sp. SUN019 TaxID=2937788 RepID=UPI002164732C|nr:helix-turn-helix domain-containing protein [Sphingomonas sp. SUN019]UVO50770.1 helix-turn-helix domain-containing protein [Sphingomonas sp. SUN019]
MAITPRTGVSRDGLPLSLSRAPSADMATFVARYFITIFDQPADSVLEDFLLHETAYIRVPTIGRWATRIDGEWVEYEGPMLFGAQRKRFPVRCTGPVVAAGFAIRPAAWRAFSTERADLIADRLTTIGGSWGDRLRWACENTYDHDQTFARLETVVREQMEWATVVPNPICEQFEATARADPVRNVRDIVRDLNTTPRRLDHLVRDHFGHLPKTVLRRSRFLDMAAVMRGMAVPDADALARMRFYDASHLNREFRLFVDMTPAQFERTPTPLMTPGLEIRQQRKLIDRATAAPAPWLATEQPPT